MCIYLDINTYHIYISVNPSRFRMIYIYIFKKWLGVDVGFSSFLHFLFNIQGGWDHQAFCDAIHRETATPRTSVRIVGARRCSFQKVLRGVLREVVCKAPR